MQQANARRRILFVLPNLRPGGAERVVLTIANRLDRRRWIPALALVSREGALLDQVCRDVEIINLQAGRARRAAGALVRAIRRYRPDLVFSTLGYLNLVVSFSRPLLPRPTKLIAREAILVSRHLPHESHPHLFRLLYRFLYPRFDRIVAQSRLMAADLQEYVGLTPDKIAVIHNPVDVDEVRRRSRGEKSAQTAVGGEGADEPGAVHGGGEGADEPGAVHGGGAAGLPVRPEAGGTRLLAAGRLDRQKGFDILLQTLAALPPEYLLTIAGDGEQREELEAQAAGLGIAGRVEFAGFSANPYALMAGADIFVLSSRYEGFPNVVLEALASGTPVAAFGGPCATEEIIEEGVDGALAVPEDPASLADAVLRIAAAPPDSGTIVRRVEERFGIDQVISRYEALFEEVTER